ncbi:hypothetical protein CDAR_441441 [Caerostris darwini]|uniref:Uncharacterized protein n=1 Tax=Caerostris darwini TaxID=1538125 RepID=A0AAV4TRJ3_9ARAC|nr:hypothetical protein CDAR_441441 [Caerostris darwini]
MQPKFYLQRAAKKLDKIPSEKTNIVNFSCPSILMSLALSSEKEVRGTKLGRKRRVCVKKEKNFMGYPLPNIDLLAWTAFAEVGQKSVPFLSCCIDPRSDLAVVGPAATSICLRFVSAL